MKNQRSVCKAQEARYVEYKGLPCKFLLMIIILICNVTRTAVLFIQGSIKTGCLKTPLLNSRFCSSHKPRGLDTKKTSPNTENGSRNDGEVMNFIIAKRVTRVGTHYQVSCA